MICCPKCEYDAVCTPLTCQCHQRPETEWREEFDRLDIFQGNFVHGVTGFRESAGVIGEVKGFIDRLIQAAEQRGFERGSFQSKRLHENNQLLQKKLREGNRELLEEVLRLVPQEDGNLKYLSPDVREFAKQLREQLQTLLAFQQEPHEN